MLFKLREITSAQQVCKSNIMMAAPRKDGLDEPPPPNSLPVACVDTTPQAVMETVLSDLKCPICLDLLTVPVLMLPCQHNFCQTCLRDMFQGPYRSRRIRCPVCREEFWLSRGVDGVARNRLAEKVLETWQEEQAKPKPKTTMCADHPDERVNLFCQTDDRAICARCVITHHRHHDVTELGRVFQWKKAHLEASLERLDQTNGELDSFIELLNSVIMEVKDKAEEEKSKVTSAYDELISLLEDRKLGLMARVEEEAGGKLQELGEQADTCRDVLENSRVVSAQARLALDETDLGAFVVLAGQTKQRIDQAVSMVRDMARLPAADSHFLHAGIDLHREKEMVISLSQEEGTRFTLDPRTAHRELVLRHGNTVVAMDAERRTCRHASLDSSACSSGSDSCGNSERFTRFSYSVLGSVFLSNGTHYWEVDVSAATTYRLGVASSRVAREKSLGCTADAWCISREGGDYFAHHDVQIYMLSIQEYPRMIGVLLDCEHGTLTFFDTMRDYAVVHRFLDVRGEGPICPAFSVGEGHLVLYTGRTAPEFHSSSAHSGKVIYNFINLMGRMVGY
ncbi:TRIM55 [Branchiostoma lanceolatum]|uniref:TRIM55 protein n=1 Tax=Branchiostoma lanceolatum TaxID=7740 RepID=A0A8J9ZR65_BRALA|nr:TRIM55 [Branchiostoma lanceolatum]